MGIDPPPAPDPLAPVDMRDPAFRDDPHAILRRIRARGRVVRDVVGAWLVTGHADSSAGLRSTRLSREPWRSPAYRQHRPYLADSTLERAVEHWMLFNDPPKHTRLRRLVNGAFKPPVVEALRERIAAATDELLDAVPSPNEFDLMARLAQPLPVRVICDILGLPAEDFAQTKAWSDALAIVVEPVSRREQRVAADAAARQMIAYLREHLSRHRAAGTRDDLLGALIAAQDDDGTITEEELLGNLVLLFIAGHETTTNLIGNGMLTLLRHPGELARLRAQPSLLPTAVDEALRFEGSVTMVSRLTVEPYAVGDVVIPAGENVIFMVAAANRDAAVFAEPDRFDVGRTPNPHLGFGAGIHYCVGAPLARLEAEVAFGRLLHRYPHLELADPAQRWRRLINLRGLEALPLRAAGSA
jgi:cytochrome P450